MEIIPILLLAGSPWAAGPFAQQEKAEVTKSSLTHGVELVDFFEPLKDQENLSKLPDLDPRWTLLSSADPDLTRATVDLLQQAYARMDEIFGDEATAPAVGERVTLVLTSNRSGQNLVLDYLGAERPHLANWADSIKPFPKFMHWSPLVGLVRNDGSTQVVERPEVELVHYAVHLELARRFGAIPYWIGEALSFAIQDDLLGGVYGVSNRRGWEALDEHYYMSWRRRAAQGLQSADSFGIEEVVMDRLAAYKDTRGYMQMALGHWWLNAGHQQLRDFIGAVVEKRGQGWQVDADYAPNSKDQQNWLQTAVGKNLLADLQAYWAGVDLKGAANPRLVALMDSVSTYAEQARLGVYESKKFPLVIYSDFSAKKAKEALQDTENILKRLERALGKPEEERSMPIVAFLLKDEDAYFSLCDRIAQEDHQLDPYMKQSKSRRAGFNLPRVPVTCYFHDVKFQEEAKPSHSLAHNVVHYELKERYGELPLWLAEGLACAGEEGAFGEVWANWYRDGFVYASSHGNWRNHASMLVSKNKVELEDLYDYDATKYNDDMAHLAYAFATYGLDKNSKGFKKFMEGFVGLYEEWSGSGRFMPDRDAVRNLAFASFGKNFEKDFAKWWKKPPKRKK